MAGNKYICYLLVFYLFSFCNKVYSFGFGKFGQLGQITEKADHYDPVIVSGLKGKKVVGISCGEAHSLAITGVFSICYEISLFLYKLNINQNQSI